MRALYSGGVDFTGADVIGGQVRHRDNSWLCAINSNNIIRKPSEVNVRKSAAIKGIERVIWCPNYGTCELNLPRERLCVY